MLYQGQQLTRDALNAAYLSKMEGGTTGGNIVIQKDDPTVQLANQTTNTKFNIHLNDKLRLDNVIGGINVTEIFTALTIRADGGFQVYNTTQKFAVDTSGNITSAGYLTINGSTQSVFAGSIKASSFFKTDGTEVAYNGHLHSEYIAKTNVSAYTPTADYHPATKKYVDDNHNVWGKYQIQYNSTLDSFDIIYTG